MRVSHWTAPILLGLLGFGLSSVQAAFGEASYSDTVDVVTVEVPVHVVRQGLAVRGLTAENFELFDGSRKVELTGFDVVDVLDSEVRVAQAAEQMAGAPPGGRRHLLLFFDLSFTEPGAVLKARKAAIELVERHLHETDLVGVAAFSINTGVKWVVGFSPDRRQVLAAIRRIGTPSIFTRAEDPLQLVLSRSEGLTPQVGPASSITRKGTTGSEPLLDYASLLPVYGSVAQQASAEGKVNELGRISSFIRSFGDLAQMLNSVDGKKHMVLLSEGWDSSLLTGSFDAREQMRQAEAASWGQTWEVSSGVRMGQTAELNFLSRALEEFRRADTSIHTVDVSGLRTDAAGGDRAGSGNSLFIMANETGGEFYPNFNDLGTAMEQLLDRTSVTYLLTFQARNLRNDGSFRRLRVKLRNVQRARAVHRPGFYEPTPFAKQLPLERQLKAASLILGGKNSGSLGADALATPMPGKAGKAYIPVVIEVNGNSLLAVQPDSRKVGLELYAYAFDREGRTQDFFSQSMSLDVRKMRAALESAGLKFFGHLDLAPGAYQVGILIRDARTGRHAARTIPILVPDFAASQAFLSPPLFPEQGKKWLMVREDESRRDATLPYPFVAGNQRYIPAAVPQVASNGSRIEAQLTLMAFGLGKGPFSLDGWVVGADGKRLVGAQVALVGRAIATAGGPEQLVASLKVPQLAPGEYTVVVNVEDENGKKISSSGPLRAANGR